MTARTNLTNLRSGQAILTTEAPAVQSEQTDVEHIPLEKIVTDGGTQMRAGLDNEAVTEYRDAMRENGWRNFPPVVVYYDGSTYWLADGFHRLAAWRKIGVSVYDSQVPAIVKAGGRRDAVLYAARANASHGVRRSNADKRRAVETLVLDKEWGKWGNMEISRRCGVSEALVRSVKKGLGIDTSFETKYTHPKTGEAVVMNTANIGGKPQTYLSRDEIVHALRDVLAGEPGPAIWECAAGRNPTMLTACERALHPGRARKRDLILAMYQLAEESIGLNRAVAADDDGNPLPDWVQTDGANTASTPVPAPPQGVRGDLHTSPHDADPGVSISTNGSVVASDATGSRQHGAPLGKCRVCNRPLYDPAQAAAGIGACCAAKLAAGSHADEQDQDSASESARSTWDYWAGQGWRLVHNATAERIGRPHVAAVHDGTQMATPMMSGEASVIYWLSSNGLLSAANYALATESAAAARSQATQIQAMIETLEAAAAIIGPYEKITGIYSNSRPLRQACAAMIGTLKRKAGQVGENKAQP